ncbi:glycosyltransferase [Flavobacterium sp.]|uniref:glycosyltransferase n=1 Tax=Flavobacterium sp. TaxID=239 RepID=UPI00262A8C4A|nr:glycosyltransferase [Flavobacterium sp.]
MGTKILIIGPALSMGGMERASVNLANSLADEGYAVTYLAIFSKPHFFKLHASIAVFEPEGFNVKKLDLMRTCLWIRKSVKEINPETTLVFNKFYAALALLGLVGTGRKVFISERSSPFYQWKRKINLINKFAFTINPPTGVMAQTTIAAEYQRKYYGKYVFVKVIPNALRKVALYPELKRENTILAVGRFGDHLKGFDQLIVAFSKVKNKDWKLVFAGGDEDGDDLKALARNLGVFERIVFLGKVTEIDKIYATAGIFVIPSRSEGFPNALCEAMAAGVPCVSFNFTAGPADIITENFDGIIAENGNADALANAIDALISNPEQRDAIGENAMLIAERLAPKKISGEVIDLILNKK